MKRRTITDPQGHEWRVALRWLPWSPRWRGRRRDRSRDNDEKTLRWWDWLDGADLLASIDDAFGWFFVIVLGVIAVAAAVLFVVPAFIFIVEILIMLLLVVGAIVLRVLFRRPWLIDAVKRNESTTELVWAVVGYRRSKETVDEIARQLKAGSDMPVAPSAMFVGSR